MKNKHLLLLGLWLLLSCTPAPPPPPKVIERPPLPKDGRDHHADTLSSLYNYCEITQLPQFDTAPPRLDLLKGRFLDSAIQLQYSYLCSRPDSFHYKYGNLNFSQKQIKQANRKIYDWVVDSTAEVADLFYHTKAYQILGADSCGNIHFTAYYTPVLKVRKKPNATYKYPIYKYPKKWKGKLPSREKIDGEGVLKGQGLELAYAKSIVDIFFMQIQGSGIVEFPNGERSYFAYGGKNNHRYKSIGKYLIEIDSIKKVNISLGNIKKYFKKYPDQVEEILYRNPSYVFFKPEAVRPQGGIRVPLTGMHSVAVDPKFIPLGSTLLAQIPILDENKKFSHHEYRLLLAQDTGGAIKGPGRIDLYTGIGKEAEQQAGPMNYYGKVWLLLPRESLWDYFSYFAF